MKRGSKKSPIEGDEAKRTASFPSCVGWCSLYPDVAETYENSSFSNQFGELEWVRQQLTHLVHVTDVAHPLSTEVDRDLRLAGSALFPRVSLPSPRPSIALSVPTTIYLASSNRSDSIEQVTDALEQLYPEASLQIVLGQWWVGHRRTWPIPTKWPSVYWYQCHDVVLPALLSKSEDWLKREPTSRMALIVSEDSSIRRMWLEVLPRQGFQVLAASKAKELPEGDVDVVFLEPSDNSTHEIDVLRKTYPSAKIVACFGFPEWNQVKKCSDAGANVILGKPFQMEGLSSILADWTHQE